MNAIPSIGDHPDRIGGLRAHQDHYVRHITWADIGCERQDGYPCLLDHADLPVPEGIVLGEEAHLTFLEQSGLLKDLRAHHGGGEDAGSRALTIRAAHRYSPIEGDLNREICEAIIGLGSTAVAVVSEGLTRRHLKSIPEVKEAVRDAWLSPEGLKRQGEAASSGEEIPTWSVTILVEGGRGRPPSCSPVEPSTWGRGGLGGAQDGSR
jgi:hypothetical protein